eukprot:356120-Chlamydomonas_euryale.AAC.1
MCGVWRVELCRAALRASFRPGSRQDLKQCGTWQQAGFETVWGVGGVLELVLAALPPSCRPGSRHRLQGAWGVGCGVKGAMSACHAIPDTSALLTHEVPLESGLGFAEHTTLRPGLVLHCAWCCAGRGTALGLVLRTGLSVALGLVSFWVWCRSGLGVVHWAWCCALGLVLRWAWCCTGLGVTHWAWCCAGLGVAPGLVLLWAWCCTGLGVALGLVLRWVWCCARLGVAHWA